MHKLIQKNWERQKTELTHSREMKLSQFRDENDLNADIDIWYMIYDIWYMIYDCSHLQYENGLISI